MRSFSLRSRIILAFIVLLIPAVALIVFTQVRWYQARYSLARASIEEHAGAEATSFQQYVENMGRLGAVIGTSVEPLLPGEVQKANRLMESFRAEIGIINDIAFASPQGRIIAGAPASRVVGVDVSDREYFLRLKEGEMVALGNVLISRFTGQPVFGVARAVRTNGEFKGAVILIVNAGRIASLTGPTILNEDLIWLDSNNVIAYHSRHPDLTYDQRVSVGRTYEQLVRRNEKQGGLNVLHSPLDPDTWLGAWKPLPDLGWTIGVFQPESTVVGPIREEAISTIIWAVLTLALIGILGAYFGVVLTRPASRLAKVAEKVGRGNFDVRANVNAPTEIAVVATAFNRMIEQLQAAWSELRMHDEELQTLFDTSKAVSFSLVLDEVLQAVMKEVAKASSANIVELFLYDPETRALSVKAQLGLPEYNVRTTFVLGEGVPGTVARTRAPIQISDLSKEENLLRLDMVRQEGLRSILAVPILSRGQLIGVLDLFTKEPHTFDDEEVNLIMTLASIAGTAIENARLFEREQHIARTLEQTYIPSEVSIPGVDFAGVYKPGLREAGIGGDFYDVMPIDGSRYGIVIADVSGKGLEAAVYTSIVKYTLRAYAAQTTSPAKAVRELNKTVFAASQLEEFVTLVFSSLDPETGKLCMVNAGHELPLIYRAATRKIEVLEKGRQPVGILPDVEYEEIAIRLHPGDKLVLYTDGVTEARKGDEFFGLESLEKAIRDFGDLSAQGLADAIVSRISEFSGGQFADDVTMVILGLSKA